MTEELCFILALSEEHFNSPATNTSHSLSLSQYLLAKEYITYAPTPGSSSSESTTFTQRAVISCQGLPLRAAMNKVEDLSHARFGNNAGKGKLGLEAVLGSMWGQADEAAQAKL